MKAILPNLLTLIFLLNCACLATAAGAGAAAADLNSPADKIYQRADWVFNNAEQVHYGHRKAPALLQVKSYSNGRCDADTDCSGFVSYVLSDFPKQYEAIRKLQPQRKYPQAKVYVQFFNELKKDVPTDGWLRVERIKDLRRGDLIAWRKPQPPDGVKKKKSNTGHVAIVIENKGPVEEAELDGKKVRFQSVNVIDSSSVKHFQPELLPPLSSMPHRDGLGKGVVRIILDESDRPIGYWEGTYWYEGKKDIRKPTFTESIAFARLVSDGN
jgi:cell wall-associated NlpC family hydrolase